MQGSITPLETSISSATSLEDAMAGSALASEEVSIEDLLTTCIVALESSNSAANSALPQEDMARGKSSSLHSSSVFHHFYPTALKGCRGIVFTHGVRMGGRAGGRAAGNCLSGLYLRNRKV